MSRRMKCGRCPRRFTRATGSRRLYCEECSPPRRPAVEAVEAPPAELPDGGPGPIEQAVAAELKRTGRAETIEGVALLAIARDADRLPPEKRAGVVEKLLRVKSLALVGTKRPESTAVDELARRRAERHASA